MQPDEEKREPLRKREIEIKRETFDVNLINRLRLRRRKSRKKNKRLYRH